MHVEKAKRVNRKDFTIELKDLKKVHRRGGTVSLYALNTDKGLVTSLDAIEKGIAIDLITRVQKPRKPFMTKPAMMHLISEIPDPAA